MVEKLSGKVAELIREEWRELGFFYARNDATKEWHLIGSAAGLTGFVTLLVNYARKDANRRLGEHEHVGPDWYLTVETAEAADITGRAIHGRLEDAARLAGLLAARLQFAKPGEQIAIRQEYAPNAEYALVLEVRDDAFDPSSLDPQL